MVRVSQEDPLRNQEPSKGLVCGILSIVLSIFIPLLGVILGIIGIVRGSSCSQRAGLVTSLVGTGLSVFFWALYIVLFVVADGVM